MNKTRRELLKLSLGATQVALLHRLGLLESRSAVATPAMRRPTKLVTLYVPGGWIPEFIFAPLRLDQTDAYIPKPIMAIGGGEPAFYTRANVEKNLDGSAATDTPWDGRPLRMPRLWDEANLSAGKPDGRITLSPGIKSSALCWSWVHYQLWKRVSVLHGVDQGTPAHDSGLIASLSGIAGPTFSTPTLGALIANAMLSRFPDRALPHVALGTGVRGQSLQLPAATSAVALDTISSAAQYLSERNTDSWSGFTGRTGRPSFNYSGDPAGDEKQNDLEAFVLKRLRGLKGHSNSTTDHFYENLYDAFRGYSNTLGRDVVTLLEKTKGFEQISQVGSPAYPFWQQNGLLGYSLGTSSAISGNELQSKFDLALRLLKSELSTSVSVRVDGNIYFDTHNDFESHFPNLRGTIEQIGRFLGELSLTPAAGGGSMLDDTLVLIQSEFGRTWNLTGGTDHWPATSVIFAGGPEWLPPNRMVGGYDIANNAAPGSVGYMGTPVDLTDEDGHAMRRPPQARDVIFTALNLFGVRSFIAGGPGVVKGLTV